jgi:hypothetical protein
MVPKFQSVAMATTAPPIPIAVAITTRIEGTIGVVWAWQSLSRPLSQLSIVTSFSDTTMDRHRLRMMPVRA